MELVNWKQRLPFLLSAITIILLGFGIRLHNLGGDSLWLDEQLTLQTASLGFPEILTGSRDHPPTIYILTALAVQIFGESEFAARLVSLFVGTFAIPLIILFGKVINRPNAGLWAALFLVFSPFHLKYVQESRHYALLMTVSLGSTIFLYLALARPRFRYWIGFGILTALNLYVHYGAFIVLGSQTVLITVWMVWQLYKRKYALFLYPVSVALITFLIYLPWLPYFISSLGFNMGDSTVSDTGGIDPISQWAKEAFYSFGMYYEFLPYGILGLVILGLLFLFLQRDFLTTGFLVGGIVLPFILIQAGYIARGAFARYIIYILPLYLITAAIAPERMLAVFNQKFGRKVVIPLSIISALFFISLAWRPIKAEHDFVQDDWRGVVNYLDENAVDGDVIVAISMNFANGFNTVDLSMPYYLEKQSANTYIILRGNRLGHQSMTDLEKSTGRVWIVLYDYEINIELLEELGFTPKKFQTHLYVMPNPVNQVTVLNEVIFVYEQLVQVADKPSPRCLLEKDLALLYAQSGEFAKAERRLSKAINDCPDYLSGEFLKYDLQTDVPKVIYQGAISHHLQNNNSDEAQRLAGILYRLDPHNKVALEVLTLVDLLDVYERGEAQVDYGGSLEPVRVKPFTMPQSGDVGDALLIHPEGSVSFHISLPEEPVFLISRLAMDPQSWEWGGDGSNFIVTATTEDGNIIELVNYYVSNAQSQRHWHDIEVSLAQFAGQSILLTLKTGPGPAGDFSGDWAGWESPRIMQIPP